MDLLGCLESVVLRAKWAQLARTERMAFKATLGKMGCPAMTERMDCPGKMAGMGRMGWTALRGRQGSLERWGTEAILDLKERLVSEVLEGMPVSRAKGGEEGLQVLKASKDRLALRVHRVLRDYLDCPLLFTTKNPKQSRSTITTTSKWS